MLILPSATCGHVRGHAGDSSQQRDARGQKAQLAALRDVADRLVIREGPPEFRGDFEPPASS
jgi:hypothetical protein